MSQRKASGLAIVPAPALPEDGVVRFDDGDFVRITTTPTHGQSKIVVRATLAMEQDSGLIMELENETIAAVSVSGELHATNPDGSRGEPLSFPLASADVDRLSQEKVDRLFSAAIGIRGLIPNLQRLNSSLPKS